MDRPVERRLHLQYSDNERVTVAERLIEELKRDPSQLDVATGYLTPSVWTVLRDVLPSVRRFRLLLGKDFELASRSRREEEADIRALFLAALRGEMQSLPLPTPEEEEAIKGWLSLLDRPDDEVAVRVWTEGFLHAKAYLLSTSAGVGSANFTYAGLTQNRELVAWREDRSVVAELQEWFEEHWQKARPYKEDLRKILSASRFGRKRYTPYELLIRVLADRYGTELPPSLESTHFQLHWFQEDAVFQLVRLLRGPAAGALLADAVGLGKTFMALGVIHHFLSRGLMGKRGRPVLIIVPASMQPIWERELERTELSWACRLITLQSLKETTDVTPYQGAALVVVDEAHRLRSEGVWFRKVMEIVREGGLEKKVLLLTATPVHTSLRDLTNLLRILTKNRRGVWAPVIADFEAYLRRVEKREADPFPVLERSVVRRSRSDLLRAQEERAKAGFMSTPLKLPKRQLQHVHYQYREGGRDDLFERFADVVRHLELAPYDLDRFRSSDDSAQPSELVGLFLAGLLKRFESSLRAVRLSLEHLDTVLRLTGEGLRALPPEAPDLGLLRHLLELESQEDQDEGEEQEVSWSEVRAAFSSVPRVEELAVDAVLASIDRDRAKIVDLLASLPREADDGKIAALAELLTNPRRLGGKRVLVFTQFRDTAEYLFERLSQVPGIGRLALIHGGTSSRERERVASWFDPNGNVDGKFGEEPIRVLISTDVLAEGHNLQLAQAVVNFDLHWNPQVVVQRAGRIDRLNSPHETVSILSFLPEEGLEAHLRLVQTLDRRFGLIHYLGLGDEPVTKFRGDFQATTFEQLRRLYGDDNTILDEIERSFLLGSTDYMREPLLQFIREAGEDKLREIPVGVQSAKHLPKDWNGPSGTFVAFRLGPPGEGETIWRFYPDGGGTPSIDEVQLFQLIHSRQGEPPLPLPEGKADLIDWDLLRKAAEEVAREINMKRATAAVARGASEMSRRLRNDIRSAADLLGYQGQDLDAVLDRLEEVHVEDFDHRTEYRRLRDRIREVHRDGPKERRRSALSDALQTALLLFGSPQETDDDRYTKTIGPEELVLVAWERLERSQPSPGPTQAATQKLF